jgi:aryl-alcohol dehydrogenase-like predicted oxidoreductase
MEADETHMISNPVPGTDIKMSPICLGTMTFGTPVSEADAVQLVHWALDNGVNFIDTADIYEGYTRYLGSPGGIAERILGKALKDRRDRAIVTTKVGNPIGAGEYMGTGLGWQHIHHQLNASLERLQTDYVDFYELHKADPDTPIEESLSVMADLVKSGKVRHWGFSNFDAGQIQEMLRLCDANGWPRPVIAQPLYNWLERGNEEGYLPLCRANQIAITPYQPLQGGLLTGKYLADQAAPEGSRGAEHPRWLKLEDGVHEKLNVFIRESEEAGLEPAQYALRWLLNKPGITSVVAGVKRIEQLKNLVNAAS